VGSTAVSINSRTPVAVSCGNIHTIVLMSDGTLYSCGYNGLGNLGLGANAGTGMQNTLTKITLIRDTFFGTNLSISSKTPVAVSCGIYQTFVLMSDGTLYSCGYNDYGQLGLGNTPISTSTLTKITLIRETVGGTDVSISSKTPVDVSCGAGHTIVLMSDGTLYSCGLNSSAQLGLGDGAGTTNQNILTKITLIRDAVGGTNVSISSKTPVAVSCGGVHTLVLMRDGTLYSCGNTSSGQVGLGTVSGIQNTLTKITLIRETVGGTNVSISSKTPVAVSCGSNYTLVLMSDGTLYSCGDNSSGQIGLGAVSNQSTLTKINITDVIYVDDMVGEQPPAPITNICFPAGTPVKTDQGIIEIQNINPDHHTIGLKIIKAITQTLSEDPDLICFEKDALYKDVPSEKTVMSMNHGLLFKGKWYKAQDMIGVVGEKCTSNKIYRIPYKKGTILYNVLLETHSHMLINNLIVETLNPLNEMVPLYNYFNTMKPSLLLQKACIKLFNRSKKARQTRQKALMAN
jgi:alpha-tubulin suppressor-like RCC1 family protein